MKVKYVTTRATQSPQFELFDVSFPEKLLKIVATRLNYTVFQKNQAPKLLAVTLSNLNRF